MDIDYKKIGELSLDRKNFPCRALNCVRDVKRKTYIDFYGAHQLDVPVLLTVIAKNARRSNQYQYLRRMY